MGKREEDGWEDWQSCSLACPPPPSGRKCYETWSDRMLPIPRGVCQLRARLLSQAWDAQRRTSYQLSGRAGNTRQFLCSGICSLFQGRAWLQSLSRARSIPQNAQGSAGSARICQDLPVLWLVHCRKWVTPHKQIPNTSIH